jgi:hypothetical protein
LTSGFPQPGGLAFKYSVKIPPSYLTADELRGIFEGTAPDLRHTLATIRHTHNDTLDGVWSTSVEVTWLPFEVENKLVSKEILVDLPPDPELTEWLRRCPQVPDDTSLEQA